MFVICKQADETENRKEIAQVIVAKKGASELR